MFKRLGETVRENEASFRVGVLHLHRAARIGRDDVARLQSCSRGKIFTGGCDGDEIDGEGQVRNGLYRREHGSGARHVVNHVAHLRGGLKRNAARVKGNTLSHENDGRIVTFAAVVAKLDHCGRYGTPLRNAQKSAHAERFEFGLFKNRSEDFFVIFRDVAGLFTEKCRRAEVGGRVSQSAHCNDGRADRRTFGEGLGFICLGEPKHFGTLRSFRILLVIHLGSKCANNVLREQSSAGLTVISEPVGGFKEKRGNFAQLRNSCANQSTNAFRCAFGAIAKMQKYESLRPVIARWYR